MAQAPPPVQHAGDAMTTEAGRNIGLAACERDHTGLWNPLLQCNRNDEAEHQMLLT